MGNHTSGGFQLIFSVSYYVLGEWRKLHNEERYDLYPHPICSGDKIEKNEMDGTCSAYGGEERCVQDVGGETWRKETTLLTQAEMGG